MKTWIPTASKKRFRFDAPEFDINDIAHSLSHICRFTGATPFFYSVAQHSVYVARYLVNFSKGVQLAGLMHDATEAYLNDMSRPIKDRLLEYRLLEANLESALGRHFGYFKHPAVKVADDVLLATEVRDVLETSAVGWELKYQPMNQRIEPWSPGRAKNEFLHCYQELSR